MSKIAVLTLGLILLAGVACSPSSNVVVTDHYQFVTGTKDRTVSGRIENKGGEMVEYVTVFVGWYRYRDYGLDKPVGKEYVDTGSQTFRHLGPGQSAYFSVDGYSASPLYEIDVVVSKNPP